MATKRERGSTFRSRVTYTSGSTLVNCSGNVTNLTVYKSDGTTLLGPESGSHEGTGVYEYYVSTASTDPLGLYICEWKTYFDYGAPWNYQPKIDRELIQICHVK